MINLSLSYRTLIKKRFYTAKSKLKSGFTSAEVLQVIQQYGFIECVNIINFLNMACEQQLSRADCYWLYVNIIKCLEVNGGLYGSQEAKDDAYFDELKFLAEELEFYLSVAQSYE